MRNSRRPLYAVAAVVALAAGSLLAGVGPATAADLDDPGGLSQVELEARGVDLTDAAVLSEVQKIEGSDGVILDAEFVEYAPDPAASDSTGPEVTPMAYPSGCGLTVLLYRSGLSIHSSSVTSCAAPYTVADMENVIYFWVWLHWEPLASNTNYSSGATSFTVYTTYNCVNSNSTEYRTETYGELYLGSTRYTAAAYDIFDAGAQPCGT